MREKRLVAGFILCSPPDAGHFVNGFTKTCGAEVPIERTFNNRLVAAEPGHLPSSSVGIHEGHVTTFTNRARGAESVQMRIFYSLGLVFVEVFRIVPVRAHQAINRIAQFFRGVARLTQNAAWSIREGVERRNETVATEVTDRFNDLMRASHADLADVSTLPIHKSLWLVQFVSVVAERTGLIQPVSNKDRPEVLWNIYLILHSNNFSFSPPNWPHVTVTLNLQSCGDGNDVREP